MSSMIKRRSEEAFFKPERTFPARFPNGMPVGKRTEKRAEMNRELGKLKITWCEVQISPRCTGSHFLTYAHATKSRFLVTDKDWMTAARCCVACHNQIESMSHADMKQIIKDAINKRKSQ